MGFSLGNLFGGGAPDLAGEQERAFKREQERLKLEKKEAALRGQLAITGGLGTAREAEFSFGDADPITRNQNTQVQRQFGGRSEEGFDRSLGITDETGNFKLQPDKAPGARLSAAFLRGQKGLIL